MAAPPDEEYDEMSGAGTGEADAEKNSSGVATRGVNDDDDEADDDDEYGEAVVAAADEDEAEDDDDDDVGVDGANSGGRGGGSGDVETADCEGMPTAADPAPFPVA